MKLEYPKMIYKSKTEHIIVQNIDEHEAQVKNGFMEWEILLGVKPKEIEEKKSLNDLTWHELKALAKEKDISYPRGSSRSEIEDLIRGD